jgi:hypothetical protein
VRTKQQTWLKRVAIANNINSFGLASANGAEALILEAEAQTEKAAKYIMALLPTAGGFSNRGGQVEKISACSARHFPFSTPDADLRTLLSK